MSATVIRFPVPRPPAALVGTPALVLLDARLALIEEELDAALAAFHRAALADVQVAWWQETVRLKTEWQGLMRERLKLTGAELVLVRGGRP